MRKNTDKSKGTPPMPASATTKTDRDAIKQAAMEAAKQGNSTKIKSAPDMAKGGMVKKGMAYGGMTKKGMAKGGMANCGASMKPTQGKGK